MRTGVVDGVTSDHDDHHSPLAMVDGVTRRTDGSEVLPDRSAARSPTVIMMLMLMNDHHSLSHLLEEDHAGAGAAQ